MGDLYFTVVSIDKNFPKIKDTHLFHHVHKIYTFIELYTHNIKFKYWDNIYSQNLFIRATFDGIPQRIITKTGSENNNEKKRY